MPGPTSPSQRFQLAISNPTTTLSHLQRVAQKLPDLRNTDPSTRQTSLALAFAANRVDVSQWLIDEGHDEGEISRDTLGETCLHVAAAHGSVDLLRLYLYQYSFVLDWVNSRGATPLHIAAMKGEVECAQLLIDAGAELDAPDLQGNTPIHYASSWGHTPVVKLLIDMDCQHGAKNNDDFTAADYAFSFAGLKALEDCARAHFEISKRQRQRKHSRAPRTADGGSPRPSGSRREGSSNTFPETVDGSPLGLGLGLPLPSSSRFVPQGNNPPLAPTTAPSSAQGSPATSYGFATPPLPSYNPNQPLTGSRSDQSLSLQSTAKMSRSNSATSVVPPSPAALQSIRKISLRDQDAIDSFRTVQASASGSRPPSRAAGGTSPPPAKSANFGAGGEATIGRSRSESINSLLSASTTGSSLTTGTKLNLPPKAVVRSRSASSTLSSSLGGGGEGPPPPQPRSRTQSNAIPKNRPSLEGEFQHREQPPPAVPPPLHHHPAPPPPVSSAAANTSGASMSRLPPTPQSPLPPPPPSPGSKPMVRGPSTENGGGGGGVTGVGSVVSGSGNRAGRKTSMSNDERKEGRGRRGSDGSTTTSGGGGGAGRFARALGLGRK